MNNVIYQITTVERHMSTTNTMLNRHTYTFWQVERAYHTLKNTQKFHKMCASDSKSPYIHIGKTL